MQNGLFCVYWEVIQLLLVFEYMTENFLFDKTSIFIILCSKYVLFRNSYIFNSIVMRIKDLVYNNIS